MNELDAQTAKVITALVTDIRWRMGVGDEFQSMDPAARAAMLQAWHRIVLQGLAQWGQHVLSVQP